MPEPAPPECHTRGVLAVAGATALLAVALNLLAPGHREFAADDYWFVGHGLMAGDPSICTPWQAFAGDWLTGRSDHGGWFRPIPRVLLWASDHLFGLDRAWGYHAVNCLLHYLNAMLAGAVAWRLATGRGERLAAAVAPAMVLAYPLAPGAVAWISGRTDLLGTLFLLLACTAALYLTRWWLAAAGVFAATVLAVMSKELGFFTAPMMVCVLGADALRHRAAGEPMPWRRHGAALGAVTLACAVMLVWRFKALGAVGGYGQSLGGLTSQARWWAEYLTLAGGWLAWVLVPATVAAIARARRASPLMAASLAGIVVAGLPIMGLELLPVENGRFFYLGGVAITWLWVAAVGGLLTGERAAGQLAVAAGVSLAIVLPGAVGNARAWYGAGGMSRAIVERLTTEATAHAGRGIPAIVFRNMDFVSYEKDALQLHRGAKMLPWNHAAWGVWRLSRGNVIARWSIGDEVVADPGCLLYIDEHDGRYSVTTYTVDASTTRTMAVPPGGRIPPTGVSLVPADAPRDGAHYAAVRIRARGTAVAPVWIAGPPGRVHAFGDALPGIETTHWFHLGLYDRGGMAPWRLEPGSYPAGTEILEIVVAFLPLERADFHEIRED